MKKTTLILAAAVVAFAGSNALADSRLQSPRAGDSEIRTVRVEARTLGGRADRSTFVVSPRYAELQYSLRTVKSTGTVLTRYSGPIGPRFQSPRATEQLPPLKEFQVAPLK